jgi:tetratricopeptide (TPR) repeat protein
LADSFIDLAGNMAYLPDRNILVKAKAAATKALEIDESLSEAHASLGSVKSVYEWDWVGAEREFQRAIALNASSAHTHNRYAQLLMFVGRFDQAVAESRQAQDLDPLSPTIAGDLGYDYMAARRYDDSILQCNKAIDLDPDAMWLHALLAWAHALKGNHTEAIAEYEKMGPPAYAVSAENQLIASGLGWVYAVAGRRMDAIKVIEGLRTLSLHAYVDPYWMGAIYSGLRDKDRAFDFLEKGYREHSASMAFLKADPFWDNLRSDPRYSALLRRMGLPQ